MKKIRAASGLVALGAATMLALTGCAGGDSGNGGSEGGDKGALAMSFAGRDIQLWNDMLPFMETVIEDAGYDFVTDNPEWDAQTQVQD